MTEPGLRRARSSHWVDGKAVEGPSARSVTCSTRDRPGHQTGRVRVASRRRRGGRRRDVGVRGVAFDVAGRADRGSCSASASCCALRADELAAIITAEHGKVRPSDAAGRWPAASKSSSSRAGCRTCSRANYSERVSSRVDVYSIRQPLGVVAVISPFNFPAMVPCWFFPLAIAAGNTVILKPSEKDPSAANWLGELWAEAGLPGGRVQRRARRQGRGRPALLSTRT